MSYGEDRLTRAFHAGWGTAVGNLFWYGLFAGIAWLTFNVVLSRVARSRKIVPRDSPRSQLAWEIVYSLRSLAIFGVVSGTILYVVLSGVPTRIYRRVDDHGWTWYVVSILLAVLIHDTYFYWTHRLMHHPRLFSVMHDT